MSKLLELIQGATADDLAAVTGREAELVKELDAVRSVKRILSARLGAAKKPGPAPGNGKAKHGGIDRRGWVKDAERKELAEFLHKAGASEVDLLVETLKAKEERIFKIADHPWFSVDADEVVHLTPLGRQQVG